MPMVYLRDMFNNKKTEVMEHLKIKDGVLLHCDQDVEGVVVIPDDVCAIKSCAFEECTKLTTVVMPDFILTIGECAFADCSSLTSVVFGSHVGSIRDFAFFDCTSLKHIYIPASVIHIGEGAFGGCDSLESIVVDAGNKVYDSREGCNAIVNTFYDALEVGCKASTIPSTVKLIAEGAFDTSRTLTSIEIPPHVTKIGRNAFRETGLKAVTIPSSVVYIGEKAFDNCPELSSITVHPENMRYDSREGCDAIIETASDTAIAVCCNSIIPADVQIRCLS